MFKYYVVMCLGLYCYMEFGYLIGLFVLCGVKYFFLIGCVLYWFCKLFIKVVFVRDF